MLQEDGGEGSLLVGEENGKVRGRFIAFSKKAKKVATRGRKAHKDSMSSVVLIAEHKPYGQDKRAAKEGKKAKGEENGDVLVEASNVCGVIREDKS